MHQLQVDLADMGSFARGPAESNTAPKKVRRTARGPYPYMLVAIDTFTKKATAVPMKDKTAKTAAEAWNKVVSDPGIPSYVYSDDGTEFKREFKEKLDYWDIEKLVSRGHAIVAERAIGGVDQKVECGSWTSQSVASTLAGCSSAVQRSQACRNKRHSK